MNKFFQGYLECALWSSIDENDTPLDELSIPVSDETLSKMVAECEQFQKENAALLAQANAEGRADDYLGHDFWLTRNHHGTGFWDRELSVGKELTDAAHKAGERWLYVGDNGEIYQF